MEAPNVIVITPIVAAEANDDPVSSDIRQLSRNVSRTTT